MSDDPTSRRRALTVLAAAGCAGASVAAFSAARLATAPATQSSGDAKWIAVAKLADLPEGVPRRLRVVADRIDGYATERAVALGSVYVVRKGDTVTALSAVCPHLGCTVDLAPDGTQFFCPCHTSFFGKDGSIVPGKPNKALRGMDPLPSRVTAEKTVEVQWQRFQLGTSSREVLG